MHWDSGPLTVPVRCTLYPMSCKGLTVSAAVEPPVGAAAAVRATARAAARTPATAMAMLDFFMAELLCRVQQWIGQGVTPRSVLYGSAFTYQRVHAPTTGHTLEFVFTAFGELAPRSGDD